VRFLASAPALKFYFNNWLMLPVRRHFFPAAGLIFLVINQQGNCGFPD